MLMICYNYVWMSISAPFVYAAPGNIVTFSIFVRFINGLPTLIKTNIHQFDDDLKLFAEASVIEDLHKLNMQNGMNTLFQLVCEHNDLQLNGG